MPMMHYKDALALSLLNAMQADQRVLCLGPGVDNDHFIFDTTRTAYDSYPNRVIGTPLSENMLTGACVGMSLGGLRPVLVFSRFDWLMLAMEPLVNVAAKWGFMTGHYPNMTIRCLVGRGWGQGPTHSQSLHALLAHIPGLMVYMPYRPVDAYYALRHAIASDGPTIIVEARHLYETEGNVPLPTKGFYWGLGHVERFGESGDPNVVIVGFGDALSAIYQAIPAMVNAHMSITVVDPQSFPLDISLVTGALKLSGSGNLLVVDMGWGPCGAAAEVMASVVERMMIRTPARLTLPFHPAPASALLSESWYPSVHQIIEVCSRMTGRVCATPPVLTESFKGAF